MTRLDARTASERGWMPDFCSLPILGSVVLMVELIVLVVLIAPGQGGWPTLRDLFAASIGKQLTQSEIRSAFDDAFGSGAIPGPIRP